MSDSKISISVIMPALNEERSVRDAIEATLSAFEKFDIDGEIIVVNDGSRDNTRSIVKSLIEAHGSLIRLIDHDVPKGMGRSFWDGVGQAGKEAVTIIPGDNENDPCEILRYKDLLRHVDAVIPFVYNKEVRPALRNIISSIFCLIVNVTFRTSFNYTNGTCLYRRSALSGIVCRSNGYFFSAETLMKVQKRGYLFAEVPYSLGVRAGGASKAVSISSLVKVAEDYINLIKDIFFSKD